MHDTEIAIDVFIKTKSKEFEHEKLSRKKKDISRTIDHRRGIVYYVPNAWSEKTA